MKVYISNSKLWSAKKRKWVHWWHWSINLYGVYVRSRHYTTKYSCERGFWRWFDKVSYFGYETIDIEYIK